MSLSPIVKNKFEARMGSSIEELSSSPVLVSKFGSEATPNNFGRGYVHFGNSVNPRQKDKENLEILNNW